MDRWLSNGNSKLKTKHSLNVQNVFSCIFYIKILFIEFKKAIIFQFSPFYNSLSNLRPVLKSANYCTQI